MTHSANPSRTSVTGGSNHQPESAANRDYKERVSGTNISAVQAAPEQTKTGERLLNTLGRALVRSSDAATDSSVTAAHYEALTEMLPGRLVAVRIVNDGTRAVEMAFANNGPKLG